MVVYMLAHVGCFGLNRVNISIGDKSDIGKVKLKWLSRAVVLK